MLNKDYKEILQSLLDNKVKFLIVGAYALAAYGYPRATGDFDIWVENSLENSKKIYRALLQFGAPMQKINEKTFVEKEIIFQIGVAPCRVDIINYIDGVNFNNAYRTRKNIKIEGLKVPFISKKNLIKNKQATGREKDRLDAVFLKEKK